MSGKRRSKFVAVAVALALALTGIPAAAGGGQMIHVAKPLRAE